MLKPRRIKMLDPQKYLLEFWKKHSGFTLIEMMVVVVVLAIIAAIAMPAYSEYVRKASAAQAEQEMQKIAGHLERYKSKNFTYKYFDPKIVYSDDASASSLSIINVPVGSTGDKIKYKITLRDLDDTSKELSNSAVRGSGWAMQAVVVNDSKNYNFLMTSKGLRCKTFDSITYTACTGSKVISW